MNNAQWSNDVHSDHNASNLERQASATSTAESAVEVLYSEQFRASGDWSQYPMGTRAYAVQGGYWERVAAGWKWCTGATFPRPGADAISVAIPVRVPGAGSVLARDVDLKGYADQAYFLGWSQAAKWAQRVDLISDEGSAAYRRDRDQALSNLSPAKLPTGEEGVNTTKDPGAPVSFEAALRALGLHPRTMDLVQRFAIALAEKLTAAERKHGYSDGWADPDWMDECREKLVKHVAKGDPRDVAAFCAFLWHHAESTALVLQAPVSAPVGKTVWLRAQDVEDLAAEKPWTAGAQGDFNQRRTEEFAVPFTLAQQAASDIQYADAEALISYLDELYDDQQAEKWDVAQAAIAGIRASQQPAAVVGAVGTVTRVGSVEVSDHRIELAPDFDESLNALPAGAVVKLYACPQPAAVDEEMVSRYLEAQLAAVSEADRKWGRIDARAACRAGLIAALVDTITPRSQAAEGRKRECGPTR